MHLSSYSHVNNNLLVIILRNNVIFHNQLLIFVRVMHQDPFIIITVPPYCQKHDGCAPGGSGMCAGGWYPERR